ncbi:MAG: hypothetical protein H6Q15_628 [Bacteroidetes bacterium]|nr:hypothetical protein [Bacteroidota bacterium]
MMGNSEKEKVLKLIRNALLEKGECPYPNLDMDYDVYHPINDDPVMVFAEQVVLGNGKFIYCTNEDELINKLKTLIDYRNWTNNISYGQKLVDYFNANGLHTNLAKEDGHDVGFALCHAIAARTGSIIITSNQSMGSDLKKFPPIFIIIAFTSQITIDIKDSINGMSSNMPEWVTIIKPNNLLEEEIKELYIFVVEDMIK